VKTSLDAEDSKKSNELDTNIPLYLTFLRKIYICAFAVLILWQFSKKIKKLVHRIPFRFLIRFLRFATSEEPNKTIFSKK